MSIIEVDGLRKEYRDRRGRRTVAVDGFDLHIPGPGCYGLLGPNGSGKTTTIRCLLGLVRPTAGTVRVLGTDVVDLHEVAPRIGALVEGPKFSPNASGRRNLRHLAAMRGLDDTAVERVLELVELTERAEDRVGDYSLGMGQRLGVAAALLGDPELVILDEPANGLDPAGIADMRRLVRSLVNEGRAVVMSSHQLHEIQQICDRVIIMQSGRSLAEGSVAEIIGERAGRRLLVTVDDRDLAIETLMAAGFPASTHLDADVLAVDLPPSKSGADVSRVLAHDGLFPRRLAPEAESLEAAFLQLTTAPAAVARPGDLS